MADILKRKLSQCYFYTGGFKKLISSDRIPIYGRIPSAGVASV
jgi:hypothetical protein